MIGIDLYNQCMTGEVSKTINSIRSDADHVPCVMILNDQGGDVMNVSCDVTSTLRAQDHGHPPLVFDARGNGEGGICPTITGDHQNRITDYTAIVVEHEDIHREEVL